MNLPPEIILEAVLNGLLTGAVYGLVALGLTLVYGVLHIINFAHGALLTAAMYAAYVARTAFGVDPYVAALPLAALFFGIGYLVQRLVIGPASRGKDENILLVTLGLSIIIENLMLAVFRSDTRSIDVPYAMDVVEFGPALLSWPRLMAFAATIAVGVALYVLMTFSATGKAIRAVAKERTGAALVGIDVAHIYAVTFGIGTACLAIAAALLLPSFYVSPRVGNAFVLVAFTIVVLGGMGSVVGALVGGLVIGVVESLSGLFLGESLGQIGIFLIFILVLLVRPTGLFGEGMMPILAFGAVVAAAPLLVASNVVLNFLVFTMIIALAAQGWNLLGGYGGQYSFGHAAFFGTGAYLTAILQVRFGMNAYPAFAIGIALAALVGLAIGAMAFRSGLKGSYFALVTLAFAEVFRVLANAAEITGGAAGILIRLQADPANFQFIERGTFLWVAGALVTLALVATRALERSRLGAQLVAVRENEAAAQALGVDVLAVKLRAITLSAGMTGAAGGLYAQYFLYLDANIAYGTWISVEALLAPIVGGVGTVFGPLLGAVILHGLAEATKSIAGRIPGIDLVVFGIVLILVVRFPPRDLPGLLGRWRR